MVLTAQEPTLLRREFGFVRVYRDDIQRIWHLLSDLAAEPPTVNADGFNVTCVDDFEDFRDKETEDVPRKTIERLEFVVNEPRVAVLLANYECHIEAINPDSRTRGVTEAVCDVMLRRKRRWAWNPAFDRRRAIILFVMLLLAMLATSSLPNGEVAITGPIIVVLAIAALGATFGMFGLLTIRFRKAVIRTSLVNDSPSFIVRNKDNLVVSSCTSFVLGIAVTLFMQSIT